MTSGLQGRLERLYGLERRKVKLGLDGTRSLLRALGDPQERFRAVHVAGTNGKGSVCAVVERVLRQAGHRTGLYTSPHLVDFRERIRVDGRWVDEAWLESALDRIEALPEGEGRTFFEVATALGFLWFAECRVEVAVVEVGLGGRLDCTNVLRPEACVITAIGLDHTEVLGGTLEAVASEKAGILKPGVPVAFDPAQAPAAREAIEHCAGLVGAPVVPESPPWALPAAPALAGPHQRRNLALALRALGALRARGIAVPDEAVAAGVAAARWPGRLERCPREPRLWWDGAHNAEAFAALVEAWRETHPAVPAALVLALSRDKDAAAILGALRPFAGARLVATRTRSERALEPERLAHVARAAGWQAEVLTDVPAAARHALASAGSAPVLLAGSLFAVGEAMEAFGGAPGETL